MSTSIDCRSPRSADRVLTSVALATLAVWCSSVAQGGDIAERVAPKCLRQIAPAGSVLDSACFEHWSAHEERKAPPEDRASLNEPFDLLDAHHDLYRRIDYGGLERTRPRSEVRERWSLIGGLVLLIAFAGMRRRQLFRDA